MISRLLPLSDALLLVTGALLLIGLATAARRPSPSAIIAFVVALLASPFAVKSLMRNVGNARWEPPQIVAWCPMMLSVLVVLIATALFPQSAKWRAAFVATAFVDAVLNVVNTCAPGWCGRYGFPFAYWWWSDAIVVFNGKNLTSGTSSLAVVGNVLVLLGCGIAMSRLAKRERVAADGT